MTKITRMLIVLKIKYITIVYNFEKQMKFGTVFYGPYCWKKIKIQVNFRLQFIKYPF